MALRSQVLWCVALLFSCGTVVAESTFVTAVRHAQQVADAGDYNAAIQVLEETVKTYESSSDTRTLAIALNELGRLYTDVGKPSEARKALIRSVDLFQLQFGADCQGAQEALINLADVYIMQRDFPRAQKLLEEVLRAHTAAVDPLDDTLGTLYSNLATVHLARGHTADAEQWAGKAIRVLSDESGTNPVKIASARHVLGLAKAASGDIDGSIAEVQEAVAGLERAGFAGHPQIVPHLVNLAGLYMQLREWPAAETSLDRALTIRASSRRLHRDVWTQ
jgi:tetratricopeptide (TPR) repeat protein